MNRERERLFISLVSGLMILSSGCAKNEVIKKDEPLTSATAVSAPLEARPDQGPSPTAPANLPTAREDIVPEASGLKAVSDEGKALEGLINTFESIYFSFDSAQLSEQARGSIVKDVEPVTITRNAKIRIEGNCDERGSDDYNLALGDKRANAAARYLVSLGMPADSITSVSFGKERPVSPGHDEASWAKNRRDDFVVLP